MHENANESQNASKGGKRGCRRSFITVFFVLLVGLTVLTLLQRSLMYFPDRVTEILPTEGGWPAGQVHRVEIQAEDGLTLNGWHILPNGRTAESEQQCDEELALGRPVVLYFSGNAGNRTYRAEEFQTFTRLNCDVFAFDYRGYGDNQGSPTEKHLIGDALTAWRYLTDQRAIAPSRILIFGESLGGGVATRLASESCQAGTSPGGLIVRSSFSSMVDTGSHHYPWLPVRWLLIGRYLSHKHIGEVTCPILQIHGDADRVVPIHIARRLFEAAPAESSGGKAKQFVSLPFCGHNDIVIRGEPDYSRAIGHFISAVDSTETTR